MFDYSSIQHLQVLKDMQADTYIPFVITKDSQTIITSDPNEKLEVRELYTGQLLKAREGSHMFTEALMLSPDEKTLYAMNVAEVFIWDVDSAQLRQTTGNPSDEYQGGLSAIVLDEQRQRLCFGTDSGSRKAWNMKENKWEFGGYFCDRLVLSGNGRILAGSYAGSLDVWQFSPQSNIYTERVQTATRSESQRLPISSLIIDYDGKVVFCGYHTGEVELWRTDRFESLALLAKPSDETIVSKLTAKRELIVSALALSPDEKTLAVGFACGLIQLWDMTKRTEIKTLWEHAEKVLELSFTRDGNLLVSSALDGTLRLWGNPGVLD